MTGASVFEKGSTQHTQLARCRASQLGSFLSVQALSGSAPSSATMRWGSWSVILSIQLTLAVPFLVVGEAFK